MKKKLPSAELPLPKFRSDKQAAEYFDTHSVADIWDQLPLSKTAKVSPALAKSNRECLGDREDYRLGIAALEKKEPQTKLADVRKELRLGR
jgi:hypothetical protein